MEMPSEITKLISLTSNGKIWLYIALLLIIFYFIISLCTWSFIKPMKYLGISITTVGGLLLALRILSSILINFIKSSSELGFISAFLPGMLKPIIYYAVACIIIGIVLIVVYKKINPNKKVKA